MEKTLYRSRNERVIAGVCGGLAQYLEIDPTLVRAAVVLFGLITQGGILIAYLIMAVVVPEEPESEGSPAAAVPYVAPQPRYEEGYTVTENDMRDLASTPEQAPESPAPPVAPAAPPPYAAPSPPPYAAPVAPTAPVAPQYAAPRARGTRGLWWGLALIVVGLILLADQFLPGVSLWQYWPLIIVVIGLATVIKGVRR